MQVCRGKSQNIKRVKRLALFTKNQERENLNSVFQNKLPEWIANLGHNTYPIRDIFIERQVFGGSIDAWGHRWIPSPASLNISHPDTKQIHINRRGMTGNINLS
jgi:hypothetical protein